MPAWSTLNVAEMPVISEVNDILQQLEGPLNTVAGAAEAASTALNVILDIPGIFGLGFDPLGALKAELDDLINDLIGFGLYSLIIGPDLFGKATAERGVDGFIRVIKTAMSDAGDVNRPLFDWGDSTGGILFMISAPNLEDLAKLAVGLTALFGPSWTNLAAFVQAKPIVTPHTRYEATGIVTAIPTGADGRTTFVDSTQNKTMTLASYDPYRGQLITAMGGHNIGRTTRVGSFNNGTKTFNLDPGFRHPVGVGDGYALSSNTQAKPPDWKSYRLTDAVPAVANVIEVLVRVRDSMPKTGSAAYMERAVALLEQKAQLFSDLADSIQDVITLFDRLSSVESVNMMVIPPQTGGNQGFVNEAFTAPEIPSIEADDYTMGVVLYGNEEVFDALGRIFPT